MEGDFLQGARLPTKQYTKTIGNVAVRTGFRSCGLFLWKLTHFSIESYSNRFMEVYGVFVPGGGGPGDEIGTSEHLFSIEYPGFVRHVDRALETLGGLSSVVQVRIVSNICTFTAVSSQQRRMRAHTRIFVQVFIPFSLPSSLSLTHTGGAKSRQGTAAD